MPYSYSHPALALDSTLDKGCSIFTTRALPANTLLLLFNGAIVTRAGLALAPPATRKLAIQIEEYFYMLATPTGEVSDFLNHSCSPSADMSGQIGVVALHPLFWGDEITIDYAMTDGSDYDEFDCHCGSSHCRQRITGQDWRLPFLQQRYAGYFSPYLQRRINNL